MCQSSHWLSAENIIDSVFITEKSLNWFISSELMLNDLFSLILLGLWIFIKAEQKSIKLFNLSVKKKIKKL